MISEYTEKHRKNPLPFRFPRAIVLVYFYLYYYSLVPSETEVWIDWVIYFWQER